MSYDPLKSHSRPTFIDYLGRGSIAPLMMSDERWEETKQEFKAKERKCPICKKIFSPTNVADWAYKTPKKVFCSWSCMRKAEKAGDTKASKRRTKKDVGW